MELNLLHKKLMMVCFRMNQMVQLGALTEVPFKMTEKGFDIVHELDIEMSLEVITEMVAEMLPDIKPEEALMVSTMIHQINTIGYDAVKKDFENYKE